MGRETHYYNDPRALSFHYSDGATPAGVTMSFGIGNYRPSIKHLDPINYTMHSGYYAVDRTLFQYKTLISHHGVMQVSRIPITHWHAIS